MFGLEINFGEIVFAAVSLLAIGGAFMMITRNNAVHSALWLVLVFFQFAVLYVMLGAEFLAALQVLVYTGAILVLFLFVIMLLGLREGPKVSGIHQAQIWTAWPIGLILAIELVIIVLVSSMPQPQIAGDIVGDKTVLWNNSQVLAVGGNVQAIGQTLYTQFLFPFEVASLILLLAVVGAIVLARREEPQEVEEILPSLGISLGRRSIANSPQELQVEKKLLRTVGSRVYGDVEAQTIEEPLVEQPSGVGEGTTSGVEVQTKK
jgi:NADH-quinone oxidoreductase subunit J